MHLEQFTWPSRRAAFRAWRAVVRRTEGGRIGAFGNGPDQIQSILAINLDRQTARWERLLGELHRFRTSDGHRLTSITDRLSAIDSRDGRAVAATLDVDPMYRIGDQLYVQPDARLAECFSPDELVRMSRQEVAVARSHIEAWKVIANGSFAHVLVLEDDAWFRPGARARIERGWRAAVESSVGPEGPALVYLSYADAGGAALRRAPGRHVFQPERGLWFLSGYVLSRDAAAALLRAMPVVGPVDLWMNYRFRELGALALTTPAIAQRRDAPSDNAYSILPYLARAGVVDADAQDALPNRSGARDVLAWTSDTDSESFPMALSMLGLRVLAFDGDEEALTHTELLGALDQFDAVVNPPISSEELCRALTGRDLVLLDAGGSGSSLRPTSGLSGLVISLPEDEIGIGAWGPLCSALRLPVPAEGYPIGPQRFQRMFRRSHQGIHVRAAEGPAWQLSIDESPWVMQDSDLTGRVSPHSPRSLGSHRRIDAASMASPSEAFPIMVETFPGNLATFAREGARHTRGGLTLSLDHAHAGPRPYRSGAFGSADVYGYGRFEAEIRAAKGDGVVTGFFLYRSAPRQEIDIELLGGHPTRMLTNVYFNPGDDGAALNYGYRGSPICVDLGFDATDDFHLYAIEWNPAQITWLVDGEVVHQRSGWNPTPIPHLAMRLIGNVWAPRSAGWAGRIDGAALPAEAGFRHVSVHSAEDGLIERR